MRGSSFLRSKKTKHVLFFCLFKFLPSSYNQASSLLFGEGRKVPCFIFLHPQHLTPLTNQKKKKSKKSKKQNVTHHQRLQDFDSYWNLFLSRAHEGLGSALGPILFQFPASFHKHLDRLENLGKMIPEKCSVALEFRSGDWYCEEVYAVMRKYNMALVENISMDKSLPASAEITANFAYIRMHKNAGNDAVTFFPDAFLETVAEKLLQRRTAHLIQYVFFMNDLEGAGPKNALKLMDLVSSKTKPSPLVHLWRNSKEAKGSLQSFFTKMKKPEAPPASASSASSSEDAKELAAKKSKS
jgi:uncharacterized protein YecE (DUF72 family)